MQEQTPKSGHSRGAVIRTAIFGFALGIVCTAGAWVLFVPRQGKESSKWLFRNTPRMVFVDVVSGKVPLTAGENRYWTISVDAQTMHRASVVGVFQTPSGRDRDIQVVLAEANEYSKWKEGQHAEALYFADHITGGSFEVRLPAPGTYTLAFRNTSSTINKEATAEIKLRYLTAPIK